ncbi:hypothetical protein AQUCO_06100062v1 [Aquilegia coerulea]|uniref:Uncharacterized protein n=1 Tax=Aquilegia coerulea TaxID=218851 RepID=A0A2G5CEL5_AQUCA|nr:hypothetical protein AQUCO_06100062v1 [Aquilegia coerulea]
MYNYLSLLLFFFPSNHFYRYMLLLSFLVISLQFIVGFKFCLLYENHILSFKVSAQFHFLMKMLPSRIFI